MCRKQRGTVPPSQCAGGSDGFRRCTLCASWEGGEAFWAARPPAERTEKEAHKEGSRPPVPGVASLPACLACLPACLPAWRRGPLPSAAAAGHYKHNVHGLLRPHVCRY